MAEVTRLLHALAEGDPTALARLMPLIYDELKRLAAKKMAGERAHHTLSATALVNEAYLKLANASPRFADRQHFLGAAAEAMRQLLVDHARRRGRERRGGAWERVTLSDVELSAEENAAEILALDEALRRLEEQDARTSQIVKLRYFAGLSIDETAAVMELSPRTVKRDWTYARAWLYQALRGGTDP